MKSKNDDKDVSTWTGEFCKSFFKSHGDMHQGNKSELINSCLLLKKSIAGGLEKSMTLSKIELRSMCTQLTLSDSSSIKKDSLIKSVSDFILDNYGDTPNWILAEINNKDELDS